MNSSGYVVGFSWAASEEGRHAVLWTPGGEIVDLGTLGGGYSEPHAINAYGQVVGASETSYGERHAFSWTASGGMIDLGTLGGYESWALAVSDSGQVVGGTRTYSGSRAFSWSVRDGMIDLGHLGGGFSAAFGVNASGDVVGYTLNDTHNEVVFRWTKAAGMVAVANGDTGRPIGHPFASDYFGIAPGRLVNATGQVLGYGPFAWSATGGLFNLRGDGAPAALNAQGQIVGWAQYGRATMWQIPPDPLPAVADVYVRGGVWASTNFNEHKLLVKLGNTLDYTRRGYIKFDISDFPTIGTATLRLYGAVSSGTERVRVGVFRVANQSWDEWRMTRNKQPSYGPMLGIIKVTSTMPEWVEIDVTAFVRAEQQAGRHVVSVALRALEHTSAFASFDSREAGLSGPQLVITPSSGSTSLSN